ncbi:MAG: zinc-ribbon domain-containing protein [Rhizobiales bacterium]|nr:zinc-ribbon domain-containing protein [Hyphomicrobiales bacterium]
MRIECPSCAAGFEVSPSALEPSGRTVRCAACKTTWFAPAPSLVLADGAIEAATAPAPQISEEDRVQHAALATGGVETSGPVVAIEDAPAISPAEEMPPAPPPQRKTVARYVPATSKRKKSFPLGALAAVLAIVVSFGIVSRESFVRAAPELATLYAAVGLPVNLRGLEFQSIRTRQEIQDGITVLAIEGEIGNVANRAVELPRVRLSVLGEKGVEIYSWTALLPKSVLYPHESVPFKSRLASPPAEGREIMVRFLTRADLTASVR